MTVACGVWHVAPRQTTTRGLVTMINRVAVIGTGLIGTSWAAHFLAQGLDVVASDPDPAAEDRTRRSITGFWPALASLGLAEGASPDRLAFTRDWASAVDGADFVF